MRFFITGISGFAGRHLTAHLLELGHSVGGVARRDAELESLCQPGGGPLSAAAVEACDIRDRPRLRDALGRSRPDGIFHLAAVTFVPRTIERPELAYDVNFLGTVELLAAVREAAPRARVVLITTGEIYGAADPERDLPIVETQPLRPLSPYSVSKAAADLAGFEAFWSESLDVVRARPFNHTGPGQPPEFVCSEFARALVAAEMGSGPSTLRVGNLDVERDFSDVRDVVRGYVALFQGGTSGEAYNLGSGRATSIRAILEDLRGLCRTPVAVEADPSKLRPREIPRIVGSIAKITAATAWRPAIPLRQTLADLMDDWRARIRGDTH
jgi:GDP-4-dehydro-6-deoxy-D-mannose reductase